MSRHELKFPFHVDVVLKAAREKVQHHDERMQHYAAESEAAKRELGEKGITFTEVDPRATYIGDTIRLDPVLEAKASKAQAKVEEHRRKRDEYRAFVAGLNQSAAEVKARTIPIADGLRAAEWIWQTADDIQWFGLAE